VPIRLRVGASEVFLSISFVLSVLGVRWFVFGVSIMQVYTDKYFFFFYTYMHVFALLTFGFSIN